MSLLKVLAAGNFSEHKMVTSNAEHMAKQGFLIGARMTLKRRITIRYCKKEDQRVDVIAGTDVSIKGFTESLDHVVCLIEIPGAKEKKCWPVAEWSVRTTNLSSIESGASASGGVAVAACFRQTSVGRSS